ncbi:MAG TPA: flagellar assembly protein FliH [Bacillota bacterium]|nr:flagellar assembly protein FliH [Bacillota bacterium]
MSSLHEKHMTASATKTISIKPLKRIQQLHEKSHELNDRHAHEKDMQERIFNAEQTLQDLRTQKEIMLTETQDEVEKLRNNWKEEREQLVSQAHEEGYTAGFEQAKQEVHDLYAEKLRDANRLIETAEHEHMKRIEQSMNNMIQLSIEVAEKIIHTEIEKDREYFISLVKGAIEELKELPEIHMYVPAEHYEFMLLQKSEIEQWMNGKAKVSIYVSTNQECTISHPLGKVDISIDTQLTQMREKLLEIAAENEL